jgi:CheY-like chemotaxis protein
VSDKVFHVLLVEDEPRDIERIQRAFDSIGLHEAVLRVAGLDLAIEYLSGQGPYKNREKCPLPESIFISLALSRKGGFKVLKWLQGQKALRRIPVVVLASSRQPIGFEQASELGAVAYLVKPVDKEALESMVKAVLTYWKLS